MAKTEKASISDELKSVSPKGKAATKDQAPADKPEPKEESKSSGKGGSGVWVRVNARAEDGFWRCGIKWPHSEIYRKLKKEDADRLVKERNLVASIVDSPPKGWAEDGTFTPPSGEPAGESEDG